ncbi:formate-dependent nitrite reductase, membrane component [Desulfitobacterium dichloroeliminans LMG P-21439]|uniref:Formate-dependent nitrite reductase, membrane component n=1 Tax=Desulfitobacterium dichloroeliminans (strain LMG P-21439 / DCA1) TaxID=871963 RepID=L0F5N1_DESDL|nr:NrfD/PsrC family molybdoenzyme membrane anchor subunit [Desulfitobacterium dichloroeliminans]AGA68482.1 formate-dependent nitrite reductase, membrane component [Desulfitobacterium dichloroeliminans LMG P-21439]
MTVNNMYTFMNESNWEALVPLYFFIISISAGSLMIASLSTVFGMKHYDVLVRPAAFTSLIALALAPLFLILDLQQPMRFLYVINPLNFNVHSPMSWGGWLLILYGITLVLFAMRFITGSASSQAVAETAATASGDNKVLNTLVFIFALLLSAYPGFELGVIKAKVLWNTELLPVYFITTSLLAGLAILILAVRFTAKKELSEKLVSSAKTLAISLIVISLIWIASRSIILATSGLESQLAVQTLWSSGWFVVGELVLGLLAPLALLLFGNVNKNRTVFTVVSVLLLIGVFSMRYSLVFAGLAAVMP